MKKLLVLLAGIACLFILAPASASAECSVCGDLTGDGDVDIDDVVAFVDWYFNWPNPITPACPCAADVNCDGGVTVNFYNMYDPGSDLGYLLTYMFYGGNEPCDPDGDSVPNCDHCN